MDAYLFVFNLVAWPVGVWLNVLMVVLVPLAARIQHEVGHVWIHLQGELHFNLKPLIYMAKTDFLTMKSRIQETY